MSSGEDLLVIILSSIFGFAEVWGGVLLVQMPGFMTTTIAILLLCGALIHVGIIFYATFKIVEGF